MPSPSPGPPGDGSSSGGDGGFGSSGGGGDGGNGGGGDGSGDTLPLPGRVSVRRPDDLLVLDISFFGFTLRREPLQLERNGPDAGIIVHFPPQSFGEEAWLEAADEVAIEDDPKDNQEVTDAAGYPDKNVEGGSQALPKALPAARMRMAGPSRVAITMPAAQTRLDYDLASVLAALRSWPMRLDPHARPDPPAFRLEMLATAALEGQALAEGALSEGLVSALEPGAMPLALESAAATGAAEAVEPASWLEELPTAPLLAGPREPAGDVTALELPYRLTISPLDKAVWRHSLAPVSRNGRTELWHSRLGESREDFGGDGASRIRALWSPDYRPMSKLDELIELITVQPEPDTGPAPNPDLIRMSLDPVDRSMLVTLMSGYDARRNAGQNAYEPISSEAKRLHLSALGALLEAEGSWTTLPDGIDLQQWRHVATLGRDHYVRVTYAGYLCPFGHAASLVKVTERKFEALDPARPDERVAVLRQRFFIVVREPVRLFNGARHKFQGRNFPFRKIEIGTRVTPALSEPGMGPSGVATSPPHGLVPRMLFWPMVPGASAPVDYGFQIVATDLAGNETSFAMPLLFVSKTADEKASLADPLIAAYNDAPADSRRRAATGASTIAYAPQGADAQSGTSFPTRSFTFRAARITGKPRPGFYPEMDVAVVGVQSLQKLLAQPDFFVEVAYPDFYKNGGFAPATNAAQIFLKLTKARELGFGGGAGEAKSDALGALASPQMNVLGLSTTLGPVGGTKANDPGQVEAALGTLAGGKFDPLQFFNDAKILGGISLGDILKIRPGLTGTDVPRMLTRDVAGGSETSFYWSTDVDGTNSTLLIPRADPGQPPTRLTMQGTAFTPSSPAQAPRFDANASLNNFKVNLFGFIVLWFEQLDFVAKNGQKPDVTVAMRAGEDAVQFGGPLEFVNSLRRYIPSDGFSDPPALTVTPSGIAASYTLNLPAIEVGIFALSNASLSAAFNLPFDARPASVRFGFSERHQPFSLTVSLLGGGGFFAIGVSSQGVNEIEAALEFGAAIAINLGVASGSVEVKAGIYFHWLEPIPGKGSTELAGYVRIHGELSVLAIISVSLTFNLQLGYLKQGGKGICYGEATLTVEIEILMFSASVSVSCRREFAGGEADPRFIDLVPNQSVWADYCAAFAPEGGL